MSSSTPDISPLAVPGAVLGGKYRLESMIGMGGMGSVWAASHASLGQPFAIKIIAPALAKMPEAVRRFDVEAKAAVQIRSRHVPQVFDNGLLDDGTPYIVMERLHGEPLTKRIERAGTLPLAEVVSVLTQCCRALTKAHALGIVHRDIKPDNIYLAQADDEDGWIAKVLDFGVAKITVTLESASNVTRTGALIGTPAYMSPEQARALSTLDHRTDLFSLGLVAYAMITGRQAFTASSLGEMLLQICALPLPGLAAASPNPLPPAMEGWFQKACAREPGDRFPTAAAWSDALVLAAGLSASQLAGTGKAPGAWSALPPPNGSAAATGPNPVASAQSAPRLGPSTTGASSFATEPALSSRKQGAIVAGIAGVVTLAAIVGTITLVARARSSGAATAEPTPPAAPEAPPASGPAPEPAASPPPIPSALAGEDEVVDASAPRAVASTHAPHETPKPAAPHDAREPRETSKPTPSPPRPTKSVATDNAVGY